MDRNSAKSNRVGNLSKLPAIAPLNRQDWIEMLAILLITFVPVMLGIFKTIGKIPKAPDILSLLNSIPDDLGLSLVIWLFLFRSPSFKNLFKRRSSFQWLFDLFLICMIVCGNRLLKDFSSFIAPAAGLPDWKTRAYPIITAPFATAYVIHYFFGALYEESVRVFWLTRVRQIPHCGPYLTNLVAATLFALPHGYAPAGMLSVFITGVFYGIVYQTTRRFHCLVIAHWISNIILMITFDRWSL